MQLEDALSFARGSTRGVVTTIKRDGRPQLSNIAYALGDDGVVRVSVTDGRAKTRNLRRDPRASLYVTSRDFWSYVVIEGEAQLSPLTTTPGDDTGRELAAVYRAIRNEDHPDWDAYYAAMVRDRRLVLRLHPQRAYGMLSR